jgi:acyl transferase domain-containing protein
VIKQCYETSELSTESISYIETHGTGTKLGDPIEFEALCSAYNESRAHDNICYLGSVKANIGHTASAAGITGIIKILQMFKYCQIPPQINYDKPNPHIDLINSPFCINTSLINWEGVNQRAAISAFGFSGTNAHVVMENYAQSRKIEQFIDKSYYIICVSGHTLAAFKRRIQSLLNWANENKEANLSDLQYSLNCRKPHLKYRQAIVTNNIENLINPIVYG